MFGIIKNGIKKRLQRFIIPNQIAKVIAKMTKSIITKSFKFHISKPSKIVQANLEQTLYLCRQLYNASLQERRDAYQINRISINYQARQNQLPEIKVTNPEYKSIHSQVLQNVLKRCERAFDGFFRRIKAKQTSGFPRFKGQNRYDSFCYPQTGFSLTGDKLTLSKIGKVKIKLSRAVVGKIKTCTIKKEINKWFVMFTVETAPEILPKTGNQVGIDAGIENFATLSDGTQIDNWKYYESSQKELRRVQRSVARKKKSGQNRKKAVLKLRKIHQQIKNRRSDFQHKLSTHLVKEFDFIAIEKLNVIGLCKGILSKQVHDVSWSSFFGMIRYKAANAGKELKEVSPNYTSQTCLCGHREKKTLAVRWHNCLKCGLSVHRDILSSKIILLLGLSNSELTKDVGL